MAAISRPLWLRRVLEAWGCRPLVWLSGVRRVGKTTLARMLPDAEFLNCDLPSVRRMLRDTELFLESRADGTTLILDEVHRLANPSELLKIVADEYPGLRVLATGSSTLAATRKFRDSLTGRKHSIHLQPVLWEECPRWVGSSDLERRLLHGGLPDALLSRDMYPGFYSEWIDSFYARDIEELFRFRSRRGFLALFRLLLRQSGGQLQVNRLASDCGLSRPTVRSHLEAMAITHAVHLLRPYHGGGKREIVARPKCYGFDTGFVCFERGWMSLRPSDRGVLWEHLVLDTLKGILNNEKLFYWQDKAKRELDFVIRRSAERVDVVECKINPDHAKLSAIRAFRKIYPEGRNFVVSPSVKRAYTTRWQKYPCTVCDTRDLAELLGAFHSASP